MKRRVLVWTFGGGLALAVATGGIWWSGERGARALERQAVERREAAREREEQRAARLRRESERLLPPVLEGLYLGMPLDAARDVRPAMVPVLSSTSTERDGPTFEEQLATGERAVYVFARSGGAAAPLERVQVLSLLPSIEAIAPHLEAMNAQYGAPTGIWDCPRTGNVPTRRFTWRQGESTVSDIFLIAGDRVSATLYIAPNDIIERSLRMGACRPIQDRHDLAAFPVASPEELARPGR